MATFVDIRRRDPEIAAGTAALLERIGALRAAGCGSLELAWVADGRLHGWVQADVEPWDWHPGALLVAEAGGADRGRRTLARRGGERRAARRPTGGRSLHRVSETRRNPASELTTDRPPSIADAVGGPLGVAESVVPAAAYVLTYTVSGQDTTISLIVAVGLGVLFGVARLIRRQTVQFALAGIAGLALSAYVVSRTGRAADFFLPGLLANAGYALAYLISIIVRWPLLGVIVATLRGGDMSWRKDPRQVRDFSRASWVWVVLFSLRLAVQLPLYLADAVTALGVARIAMGIPLFAVGIWLSWLILRPRT